jgi:hypothetical protein
MNVGSYESGESFKILKFSWKNLSPFTDTCVLAKVDQCGRQMACLSVRCTRSAEWQGGLLACPLAMRIPFEKRGNWLSVARA